MKKISLLLILFYILLSPCVTYAVTENFNDQNYSDTLTQYTAAEETIYAFTYDDKGGGDYSMDVTISYEGPDYGNGVDSWAAYGYEFEALSQNIVQVDFYIPDNQTIDGFSYVWLASHVNLDTFESALLGLQINNETNGINLIINNGDNEQANIDITSSFSFGVWYQFYMEVTEDGNNLDVYGEFRDSEGTTITAISKQDMNAPFESFGNLNGFVIENSLGTGSTLQASFDNFSASSTPALLGGGVPEPSTVFLLLMGIAGAGLIRLKKKKQ